MSKLKHHGDNLSESSRRTAVGLTGIQKRLFSDGRKILGGGGGKESPSVRCAGGNSGNPVSGSGCPSANHLPQHHRHGDRHHKRECSKPGMHPRVLRAN